MASLADQTLNISSNALQVKRANQQQLLQHSGVRSVGIGEDAQGNEVIVVGVEQQGQQTQVQSTIPSNIQGIPTVTRVVGDIVPQQDRMGTHRPVPQGVSVAHPDVTAGTVGWMYETSDGTQYIGGNNHVLANSNAASDGDPTLQPGPADGGTSGDQVGTLAFYVPIENGVNVDLAITEMTAGIDNTLVGVSEPIGGIVDSLSVGDELTKSGRTTGVTTGIIDQLDASVNVNYGGSLGTVTINGNILTESMSQGGDSGSSTAKVEGGQLLAAGRLYAGSSSTTVHSHIHNEIDHLQNDFDSSIALLVSDGDGGQFVIDGPQNVNPGQSNQWSVTGVPTDATSVEWTFGDGSTATGNQVTHTYSNAGDFTITAEAIGPGGATLGSASFGSS